MGFERNEEGLFVRDGQNESDREDEEDDDDEEQEEMNVDEEESDTEPEVETHRREIRQKKRQEKTEEGSSSVDMAQICLVSIEQKKHVWSLKATLRRSKRSWDMLRYFVKLPDFYL
ncbi:hypothetical protein M9H77_26528 [Catharanthus roseus]|uniref:Uncharacterized protein n=1 Tax=Catharanthus roseus TaxID=4058 RepID=A0ACC0ABG4_CATRO|nr:hypothetical protein M9H77_26528 [Catharanthus roseus]